MNWLAHLVLAEPSRPDRLGSILPDFAGAAALASMPAAYRAGIERHRRVDAFTDAHPLVRRRIRGMPPPFRRLGGVLVDIFFDHFLANDWAEHCTIPLPDFAEEVYGAVEAGWAELPAEAQSRLARLREANWLCAYGETAGLERVLIRLGSRLRRPVDLRPAMSLLESDYDGLRSDFRAFFPEVRRMIAAGPGGRAAATELSEPAPERPQARGGMHAR